MRRFALTLLLVSPLLSIGIAGCGGGGGASSDDTRTAFVEVTSSPSGLPVEIQLNNTRLNATTPVAQDMRYDAFCAPGEGHCTIIGSAFMNIADPNKARVTFCLKDGGKRQCDSSNAFVTITLEFEPD